MVVYRSIKHEFENNTEKSERRFRAPCTAKEDGCNWRTHASAVGDNVTNKVNTGNWKVLFVILNYLFLLHAHIY